MSYTADKIRNICLLGHGGDGKTSLAESMLYLTKNADRLGKVADGNTVCDFDPEETRRQFSISAAVAPVETNGYKINVIDTPGFFDFAGEVMQAVRVCEAALIVLTAKSGIAVGTEKSWKYATDANLLKMFYISKIDEENANFMNVLESLREKFGVSVCPVIIPVMEGEKAVGIYDMAAGKAFKVDGNKRVEMEVPASMADTVAELNAMLAESIAETSDDLMEKFFADEPFTQEEISQGLKTGIKEGSICPVFCGSAFTGFGTVALIDSIIKYIPSPVECDAEIAVKADSDEEVEIAKDASAPATAFVFKTSTDQYGRMSFFKVMSGKVTSDMSLKNARTGEDEKMGHIYMVRGKKNIEVDEVCVGDIGAVAKLVNTKTNDTLCAGKNAVAFEGIKFAEPCYRQCITPKVKGGEEKIASGLTKLRDEDCTIQSYTDTETKQFIVAGAGDMHIDVICAKLKSKFGVEPELSDPIVPYREKIRKKVTVEGKHKKQSGGHGQYGHVKIEFEPWDSDELVFEEKIFGGSVPKNFHPAVEKGLRDSMERGVLAGYPVVGLKATLVDGSYHDVDSNELSFKMAARIAYKTGLPQANPVIMEPIGELKVTVPDANMGDIIGDLNKRRGRVMGMNPIGNGESLVEAEVPMAEMAKYSIDLRSMTQGRGSFSLNFVRYEDTPAPVQAKVIETSKLMADDDDE